MGRDWNCIWRVLTQILHPPLSNSNLRLLHFKPSGRIKQDVGMESKDEELIISLKDLPGLHCSEVKRLAKLQARVDDDGF